MAERLSEQIDRNDENHIISMMLIELVFGGVTNEGGEREWRSLSPDGSLFRSWFARMYQYGRETEYFLGHDPDGVPFDNAWLLVRDVNVEGGEERYRLRLAGSIEDALMVLEDDIVTKSVGQ